MTDSFDAKGRFQWPNVRGHQFQAIQQSLTKTFGDKVDSDHILNANFHNNSSTFVTKPTIQTTSFHTSISNHTLRRQTSFYQKGQYVCGVVLTGGSVSKDAAMHHELGLT